MLPLLFDFPSSIHSSLRSSQNKVNFFSKMCTSEMSFSSGGELERSGSSLNNKLAFITLHSGLVWDCFIISSNRPLRIDGYWEGGSRFLHWCKPLVSGPCARKLHTPPPPHATLIKLSASI